MRAKAKEKTKPLITVDRMQWYPVRCCCTPQKIFGFLKLPESTRRYTIRDRYGLEHEIEVKRIATTRHSVLEQANGMYAAVCTDEMAVYSDDRPLKFWRTIEGFVEIKE